MTSESPIAAPPGSLPGRRIQGWRSRLAGSFGAVAAAAFVFGLLIHALLPAALTPVWTDEVGFLKSAVETMQRGRPWTDTYLEPWAASLSALAALVYGATGRMVMVLHGLVPALAVLTFAGLAMLVRRRTNSTAVSIGCAAVVLSCPVLLLRLSEFIGLVIFLPCLFWSLYAAETRRWGVFFVAWAAAVAARQTALIWLVVPLAAVFETRRVSHGRGGWRRPALVVVLGLTWFGALALGMNLNGVQLSHTLHPFIGLDRRNAVEAAISITIVAVMAMGCAGAVIGATCGGSSAPWTWTRWLQLAVGVGLVFIDPRRLIMPDPQFGFIAGALGWPYARCVALVAGAGWAAGRFRIRRDLALGVAAMIGVVALRAVVYDTYGIEVASLALAAVVPRDDHRVDGQPVVLLRKLVSFAAVFLACFSVSFLVLVKARIDDTAAWTVLHERAIRAGLIGPDELRCAPLAMRAWYLHDYAITHPLPQGRLIAGYLRFCERTTLAWGVYPRWLAAIETFPVAPSSGHRQILVAATFRIGWFWHVRYELDRIAPPRVPGPLGPDYREVPSLPLDESDWRRLIAGTALAH